MPSHSRIFHHFECLQGQVLLGNFKMRCKHCRREVSGSCKATSNFYTHMKRHHADIHQELKEPLPASETAPREPRLTPPSSSPHPGAWNPRDPRQRALTDAVVDFLSHSLQPLSLVEDPSFKTLLKLAQPSFSLPSLDRLRYEVLPARTASLYSSVSSRLSKIPGLCLTLDVWAEGGRGRSLVVGVAGHYIQDASFRPRSVLLACRRVRGRSGEEREEGVLSNYQEVVSSFGLEDKVVTLIAGSGVDDDGPPVGLPGWEEEEEEEEEEDEEGSDGGENGVGTATEATSDPGPPLSLLPHCFPCFSRALESVVADGLRCAGHLTSAAVRRASKLLADPSRREIASQGLFSDPQRRQQQQRGWTDQARALRSVVLEIPNDEEDDEEEEEEEEELDQSWRPLLRPPPPPPPPPPPASPSLSPPSPANFPSDRLSDTEVQALRELLGVLRPFELALEQAEGSGGGGGGAGGGEGGGGRGTASCVLPCIRGLRAELDEMGRRGGSEPLLLALRSSAESRLSGYEGEEAFVLAAALDPRWKLDWCSGAAEALEVKKLLAGKVAAMVASPEPNQNPLSSTLQTPPPPKKKKKKMTKVTQTRSGLFRFMGRSAPGSPQPGGAASGFTASQVEVYLSQPCIPEDADPLAFWYHHQGALPHLAHLAAMYLATPASPGPVRRLFSLRGGKTFGPLGASLSDFRFEEMMFLRCNGMWK